MSEKDPKPQTRHTGRNIHRTRLAPWHPFPIAARRRQPSENPPRPAGQRPRKATQAPAPTSFPNSQQQAGATEEKNAKATTDRGGHPGLTPSTGVTLNPFRGASPRLEA